MKAEFKLPQMEVIHLRNEDVVTSSSCIGTYTCKNYICYECPDMCGGGPGTCLSYDIRQ